MQARRTWGITQAIVSTARGTLLSVVLLALVCALGWPSAAFAAEAAAPELLTMAAEPLTMAPEPVTCATDEVAALPPEPMCEIVSIDPDEDGFFAAAPICDPDGASALAPEPVHPIGNDRIEATPSCDAGADGSWLTLEGGKRSDDPGQRISTPVEPAMLPDDLPLPRWWGLLGLAGPARLLGDADGVRRRLEDPPTGA